MTDGINAPSERVIEILGDAIIRALVANPQVVTKDAFQKKANEVCKEFASTGMPPGFVLLDIYRKGIASGKYPNETRILKLFRKRAVRSLSGVSVISLLTKFWGCPGKCVFCPTFADLPKSYVPDEPAVMRAQLNDFDTVRQIQNRLRSLEVTGHAIAKCDVRVIGGTWSVYPKDYREMVMLGIYDGHTNYASVRPHVEGGESGDKIAGFKIKKTYEMQASASLLEAQTRNESAESRVIGVAIETRPDWITPDEIRQLRQYGVTRVEIGYQTTDDTINELNKRGHGNAESIRATQLLKDAGFKVVAHMMPNLLGATPEGDIVSLDRVFSDASFRPDELKIYPMVVTDHAELTEIWKNGGFEPYSDEVLIELMSELEGLLPEYVRLNRSYRDIPANQILAGCKSSNLRELTATRMKEKGIVRKDISAREIRAKVNKPENAVLEMISYEASGGKEYFLQYIDPVDRTLFGLLRLRIPSWHFSHMQDTSNAGVSIDESLTAEVDLIDKNKSIENVTESTESELIFESLRNAAIIREIHVFGDQLPIGAPPDGSGQHMGFGRKLLACAEEMVRKEYPDIKKMAVISGVGVRGYYRKFGYELSSVENGGYMVKEL